MQYETLLDGTQIPILGLGTWQIGGGMTPDRSQDAAMVELLKKIIRMGYTHLDTAEAYGGTHTEELVGQAIRDFAREDLFITTKVRQTNLRYGDVQKALAGSLQRMGLDYVDLYLIHWPNEAIPLKETFRALNEIVAEGKVKRLGVSNFNLKLLKESIELAETPLAANQVRYNLLSREYEENGVLEFCQEQGIVLTAYSPLKDGVLNHPTVIGIAQELGVTAGQVALNWLTRQPKVITIPKSTNEKHLAENLTALEIELSSEMVEKLNNLR